MAINLAGIYYMMKMRVLIIDADFYSGGVSAWLDIRNQKDIFMMIDSISNNRYSNIRDYVTSYNNGIDVLASPRDPRCALKVDCKYIPMIFEFAKREYDVILFDTSYYE
jgi:pilus assembly protein CpaE